uniref:Putative conserved secreted protein n=1 Tax=Ixodes scapularis TaxID=6945 RepID=A0A4D5RCR3_IXOSC
MNRMFVLAATLALVGMVFAAPAEEAKPAEAGDEKKDVEGRIGYGGPGFGGGAFGSGFNRGGSFGVGAQGNQYGQGGFGYNQGGSNRRVYGNTQTYGDRESFGLSSNAGANRRYGQGSFGNRFHQNAGGAGGQSYGAGEVFHG